MHLVLAVTVAAAAVVVTVATGDWLSRLG